LQQVNVSSITAEGLKHPTCLKGNADFVPDYLPVFLRVCTDLFPSNIVQYTHPSSDQWLLLEEYL
jgi:hypothetical protein